MPNLIISKVPSSSGSPGNLVIDKYVPPSFTASSAGEIYWRWEDDPTMAPQFLEQQQQGTIAAVPFDLMGRAIRLFLVSRTTGGQRSVSNVLDAEQLVFTPDPTFGILTDLSDVLTDGGIVLENNT